MPGLIIRYEVEVGQQVKAGDTVVILEAMKMESALPAPVDGTVQELRCKPGDRVAKDAVIAVIG
jgi:biotin carboxyl carrier protein